MGSKQNFGLEAILSASRHNFKNVGLLITNAYYFNTCIKSSIFLLNILTFSDHEQCLPLRIITKNETGS